MATAVYCYSFHLTCLLNTIKCCWRELLADGGEADGHGEDDGGVVLRRNAVQRLQVAQLHHKHRCGLDWSTRLTCSACGDSSITCAASLSALDALCSPSAAITCETQIILALGCIPPRFSSSIDFIPYILVIGWQRILGYSDPLLISFFISL